MQQVGDGVPPGVGVPPGLGEGDGDVGVGVGEGAAGLTLIMEGAGGSSYCSSGAVGSGLCWPVCARVIAKSDTRMKPAMTADRTIKSDSGFMAWLCYMNSGHR